MSMDELIIEGARQNNLKGFNLSIPHDKVVAVTGVSGSGKSSLAFDTIFAEGQWRFIESLSTYARLFLEKMDRPEVDSIENIRPAIALEQRNPVRGSRTTVGTLTEMYDFLRLIYSKVATPYCPKCGKEIRSWEPSAIKTELLSAHEGGKAIITFPSDLGADDLEVRGFKRVLDGGEVVDLEDAGDRVKPPFEVVLDRLVLKDEARLSDSIEMALHEGNGIMKVMIIDGPTLTFTSRNACDRCDVELPEPSPLLFSFNQPIGACPECKGFGNVLRYDEELIIPDKHLSLAEGAIEPWEKPAARWWKRQMLEWTKGAGVDVKVPFSKLSKKHRKMLFEGDEGFLGINDFFADLEGIRYKLHVRVFLSRYRKGIPCPECGGKRLQSGALGYKLSGLDISEVTGLSISELVKFLKDMELSPFKKDVIKEPLRQMGLKLQFLKRVGLDYLTLSREGKTLSGGEYQRINLSNQLSADLTGTLYVLDEPTVGLHKRDTDRVSEIMGELAEAGNTIVVVEHDKGVIESADWIVELGPGGGHLGGDVVFSGKKKDFMRSDTLTAKYLRGEEGQVCGNKRRKTDGKLTLKGASGNNLRNVDLEIPLGTLTCVTGVSGSGKSSLIVETLYRGLAKKLRMSEGTPLEFRSIRGHELLKSVKLIDHTPIGRSPRSNPVTYLKVFDHIRKLFASQPEAKSQGMSPGFFSFNVPGGRCETCKGEGYQKVEMYFFEDLYIKCEDCGGRRYGRDALKVRYRDRSIDDILKMTVDEAIQLFSDVPQAVSKLMLMRDIGLGYLRLGQPATTLSGGEAQRLKVCAELGSGKVTDVLYVLDEPTVGLHMSDVGALLEVLNRLIDAGNTVVVIEHNLDVIKCADWIVDLGPEGGASGGEILFSGVPEDMLRKRKSHTARYLKGML